MSKVGIVDADLIDKGTRFPNLALMKISAFNKSNGNTVTLLTDYSSIPEYDKVYISKVFSFTKTPDLSSFSNVELGGTGFFDIHSPKLPEHVEHMKPDYSLYTPYIESLISSGEKRITYADYLDASIGFTTRGCFRKCSFCVNRVYDRPVLHSPVKEFYDSSKKYTILLDDNFLAYSGWEPILDDLVNTGKPFQFMQGLDIRLLTDHKAERLSKVKYKGDFIFAFDNIEDKPLIERKLQLWRDHTNHRTKLYVLSGFSSQDASDVFSVLERISICQKWGCLPYIMRHADYNKSPYKKLYNELARWCNQPSFFTIMSFREFAEANQKYNKPKRVAECSCLRVLHEFEKEYPEASRYFDSKFPVEYVKTKK